MRAASLGMCLCLVAVGCGGDWGTATGSVTLDDVPLADGLVTFHPVGEGDKTTAYGSVKDGEFSINTGQKAGLKIGLCRVTVYAATIPRSGSGETAKPLTPLKYARPETSKLEADVKPGSNRFKFELTSKP